MTAGPREADAEVVRVVVKPETAAAMLDCSRQHIYELVARGQLRKVTIGKLSRIPVVDIYALAQVEPPATTLDRGRRQR